MKKIISVFFVIIVLAGFAIPVSATSQEFTITIPDYMEKVTDTQWFTDDYIISVTGERAQVTMTIGFYPITQKEKDFLIDSAFKNDLQAELEKDPLFKEFVVPPLTTTTLNGYNTVYTSYIKESNGMKYSACSYYFFSNNQKCVVSFNSTSPFFVTSEKEAEKIVNTLSFSGDFRKKIEYVPNYEIPTMPEIEFYTQQEIVTRDIEDVESEIKSNAIKTGLVTAAVFAVIAIVVVLIIKAAKKGKGGKKLTTAEKVAQLTKEQQDRLYKIGKIALIVSGTFFVICLSAAAMFLYSMSGSDPIDTEKIEILSTVVVVVMFVLLGAVAAIKGRYPYWSDSNWLYLIKMRKGKVPQVCKQAENTPKTDSASNALYWAPVVYGRDAFPLQNPDYNIHVFPKAGQMINNGMRIPCDTALPEGYSFTNISGGEPMRLKKVRNSGDGKEWIPLFSDINSLLRTLSPNTRVALVDYETACGFAKHDTNGCSGIVINPGKESKVIPVSKLTQPQPYEQTLSFEGPQKDKKAIANKTSSNRIIGAVLLVLFALALYGATLQADFGGKFIDIFFGDFNGSAAHNIGSIIGKFGAYIGMFFPGVYLLFKKEE